MIDTAIETISLTKYYGKKVGCNDISISVERGEIFGLLGPNGAGKSTFIKLLTGLLYPTSGSGKILGMPLGDIKTKAMIGYLPENFKYQDWMTGTDLLSFHASLLKLDKKEAIKRSDEVLDIVKLKGHEKYRVGTYSKGMQQRLGLAAAIMAKPELLFLDEPTSALDPIGRKEVREIIRRLKSEGKTVLLNSHLLSEVETVCKSVAIINKGSIVTQESLDKLLSGALILEIEAQNINENIVNKLKEIDPLYKFTNDTISLSINNRDEIPDIASMITQNGGRIYRLSPHGDTLESKFIRLVEGGDNL